MDTLYRSYRMLLSNISTNFIRCLHDEIKWDNKLIAILGPRGVDKTTMLLQHIKLYDNINETLFVTADDLYFAEHKLIDLAMDFYQHGGKKLYIDEIHKYGGWAREIKNIYDLIPKLQVVYAGSSILDLEVGKVDLSRRKLEYRMMGLSFREYLAISYGYYPFFQEKGYLLRLQSIIKQTLENDIPTFANMNIAAALKLKRLLYIIVKSVPFKPNFTKLATLLDMNRNTVSDLMCYLEKAGIINQLRAETEGIRLLGKVDKVYLNNTNLVYVLSGNIPDIGNVRRNVIPLWVFVSLY